MDRETYEAVFGARDAAAEAKGRAESILMVLETIGFPVSDAIRESILGCTDLPTLDVWIHLTGLACGVVPAKKPPRVAPRKKKPTPRARKR